MKQLQVFVFFSLLILNGFTQAQTFETRHWQTSTGVPVVFYQSMSVPMLTVAMAFDAGSARDGDNHGISALTANLLNQGNASLDASLIAEQLADTGAQYASDTTRDMAIFSLKTLVAGQPLNQSINIFNKIITRPDFPDKAFLRVRDEQSHAIKQDNQSPNAVAAKAFFKAVYQNHPYAHPVLGTNESLEKINKQALIEFYKQHYTAKTATLVLVGAVSETKARKIANQITANLPEGKALAPIADAPELDKAENISINFPSSQSVFMIGQLGITHHNPDYFPLIVGNYILGGGTLVSRLAIEVREKRGLSYGVSSQFIPMPGKGPFLISLATQNTQAQQALQLTQSVVKNFVDKGPEQKELEAAKQYMTGSFPLKLASNHNIASMLLRIAFYKLPDDYLDHYIDNINQVTLDKIHQAFQKQVQPRHFLIVRTGKL